MGELEIDANLVSWIGLFLSNRKIQLVIYGYDNKEREIKTGIPQGSLMLAIFFLIYISEIFNKI